MTADVREAALAQEQALDVLALKTPPGDGIPFLAAVLAFPGFSLKERDDAWEAFQDAVLWRGALDSGEKAWFEYRSEYALPPANSKQEAAFHLACAEVDEARNHLVFGRPC